MKTPAQRRALWLAAREREARRFRSGLAIYAVFTLLMAVVFGLFS